MYYLVSYNDEYLSLAIHADCDSKEGCQQAQKELLVSRIQERCGHGKETANEIYEMAKRARNADDEDAVLTQYGIDVHVSEYGASIDDGNYTDRYEIVSYMPGHPIIL